MQARKKALLVLGALFVAILLATRFADAAIVRVDDHVDYYGYFIRTTTTQKFIRQPAAYSMSSDPNVITVEIRQVHSKDGPTPKSFHVELIHVQKRQVRRYEYAANESPENRQPISTHLFLAQITRGKEIKFESARPSSDNEGEWIPEENGTEERWVRLHATERKAFVNVPVTGFYSWGPDFHLGRTDDSKPPENRLNYEGHNFERCFRMETDFNVDSRNVAFSYSMKVGEEERVECTGSFSNPDPSVFGNAASYFLFNEQCVNTVTKETIRTRSDQTIRLVEDGSYEVLVEAPYWTEYLFPCRYQSIINGPLAVTSLGDMTDDDDLYAGTARALRRALIASRGEPSPLDGLASSGRCETYSPLDGDKSVGFEPHELTIQWLLKPDDYSLTNGLAAGEFVTKKGRNRFVLAPTQNEDPDNIILFVNQCPSSSTRKEDDDKEKCDSRAPRADDTIETLPSLVKVVFTRCEALVPDALFGRFLRQDNAVFDYILAVPTAKEGPYPNEPIRCQLDANDGSLVSCQTVLLNERKLVPRVSVEDSTIPEGEKTKFTRFTFTSSGAIATSREAISRLNVPRRDFVWDSREDFDRYVPLDQGQFILNGFFHQSLGHSFHDSQGSEVSIMVRGKRNIATVFLLAGHRPQGLVTMLVPEIHNTLPIQCAAIITRYPATGQMSISCIGVTPQQIIPNSVDIREAYSVEPFPCPWHDKLQGHELFFDLKSYAFDVTPSDVTAIDGLWRGPFSVEDELLVKFDDAAARRIELGRPRIPIMESLSAPSSGNPHAFWAFVQTQAMLSLNSEEQLASISACRPFTVGEMTTGDVKQLQVQAPRYSYARDIAESGSPSENPTRECTYKFNSWGGRASTGDGKMKCPKHDSTQEEATFFWNFPSGDRSLLVIREHLSSNSLPTRAFPIANSRVIAKAAGLGNSRGGVTSIFVRCPSSPDPLASTRGESKTESEKQVRVAQSLDGNEIGEGLNRPLTQIVDVHIMLSPGSLNADLRKSSNSVAGRDTSTAGLAQYTPLRPNLGAVSGPPSTSDSEITPWRSIPVSVEGILGSPRAGLDPSSKLIIKHWDRHGGEKLSGLVESTSLALETGVARLVKLLGTNNDDGDEPLPERPSGTENMSILKLSDNAATGELWINPQRTAPTYPSFEAGKEWRQPLSPVAMKADRHGHITTYLYDYAGKAITESHSGPLHASSVTGSIGSRVSVLTGMPIWSRDFKSRLKGYWAEINPIKEKNLSADEIRSRCKAYTVDQVPLFDLYRWRLNKKDFTEYHVFGTYHPAGFGFSHVDGQDTSMMYSPIGEGRLRIVRSRTGTDFPGTLRAVNQKGVSVLDYVPCETRIILSFLHSTLVNELTKPSVQGPLVSRILASAGFDTSSNLISVQFDRYWEVVDEERDERREWTEVRITLTPMSPSLSKGLVDQARQKLENFVIEDFKGLVSRSSVRTKVVSEYEHDYDPKSDKTDKKNGGRVMTIVFAVVGSLIVIIGVGYMIYRRRRSKQVREAMERLIVNDEFAQAHIM